MPAISLGDLGSLYRIQGAPSLPQIQVAGRFNLNSAIPGPVAGSNQYQFRDVFSISSTRHSLRVGGEAILEKMVHDTLLNNYGAFNFTTTNPRGTKNATADFLLGFPATMNQDAPTTKVNNDWYYALYAQDDFRVTNRLTLNLGVRWDIQTPITDPHDRFLTFVQRRAVEDCRGGARRPAFPRRYGSGARHHHHQLHALQPAHRFRVGSLWGPQDGDPRRRRDLLRQHLGQ